MRSPITRSSVSLLSLFIGLLLVSFLYVHLYLAPRDTDEGRDTTASSTKTNMTQTSGYERAQTQVDSAVHARDLLNAKNRSINKALGEKL